MQIRSTFSSTIGLKFLVALTGLFMILFVVVHLLGNLEIYSGPQATNQYGAMLRTFPKVLWGFRIALIGAAICHICATVALTRRNQLARPQKYSLKRSRKATLSSRTMMISGLMVLSFVGYHLAHYTFNITDPNFAKLYDERGHHHVYNMVVMGFSVPWVVILYVVAQALLGFHISHGISSAARTMGIGCPKRFAQIKFTGQIFALLVSALFISIPLAVFFGFLPLDP